MLRGVNWLHALVAFVLGALLGQRFMHLHPIPSVRDNSPIT